jgi:predicted alpha/beta hydrolase family esterase
MDHLVVPPTGDRATAPVVIAWHLLSPPSTPESFAAALPLAGLDAWRVYPRLPLPEGDLMQLGYADAVRNLQYPIPRNAALAYPAMLEALRAELGFGDVPIALVGGSAGSAAMLSVLVGGADVAAAVAVSPITQLKAATDATGRTFGVEYPWDAETLAMVAELDFVARASEIRVPLRLVVGAEDDAEGFVRPAEALHAALPGSDLVLVEGLGHDLADEHLAPLPKAAEVDALAVEWLRKHLTS